MLMKQPSRRMNLLIWQGSIILISLVTALAPGYYWLFFLLYFIVIMGVMFRSTKRMTKIPPQSQLGSPLFKEKNAIKTAMLDKELTQELKKQFMATMYLLLMTIIVIALFYAYRAVAFAPVHNWLKGYIENDILVVFLDFFIMYEVVTGLLALPRFMMMGKMASANIMLPQRYILYRKGLVANDRFYIEFTPDLCYEYDTRRHYVEIKSVGKQGMRVRLYTDSITSLAEKVKALDIKPCSGVSIEKKT